MKNLKLIAGLLLLCFLFACDKYDLLRTNIHDPKNENFKPDLAELSAAAAYDITSKTAKVDVTITSDGGATITDRGICWNTKTNPTIADTKIAEGTGKEKFTTTITGLSENSTYYVRAYAKNNADTSYGNEINFTTTFEGRVIMDIDGNVYHTLVIGTQTWLVENLKVTKTNDGIDIRLVEDAAEWSNLTIAAFCYYNNFAPLYKNTYGALYNWYAVSMGKLCPAGWHVPTDSEWNILANYLGGSNVAGGKLKESGTVHWLTPNTGATNESGFTALPGGDRYTGSGAVFIELSSAGYWWSSTWGTDGLGGDSRSLSIYDGILGAGGTRAHDGISVRCIEGPEPIISLPTVITQNISNVSTNFAQCAGSVTNDGNSTVTARGVCWNTAPGPTIENNKTYDGPNTGPFTSSLTGLSPTTTYYVRAYARNSAGTAYGDEISFKTAYSSLTDADGNIYYSLQIGSQVWMKENLKTTKYRDGSTISNITDNNAWSLLSTGAYCWYNNDNPTYKNTYGALYNWYAVMDIRSLCPTGWHIPTGNDWSALITYLGVNVAGDKLKEAGTPHWISPNNNASNESGFTALPGGSRLTIGTFDYILGMGGWWTATENDPASALSSQMYFNYHNMPLGNTNKQDGLSVRCVKD